MCKSNARSSLLPHMMSAEVSLSLSQAVSFAVLDCCPNDARHVIFCNPRSQVRTDPLDAHIKINEDMPGIRRINSSPDIFLVDDFLTTVECDDIINAANKKGDMELSPVAYGGWSEDAGIFARLLPMCALPTVFDALQSLWGPRCARICNCRDSESCESTCP